MGTEEDNALTLQGHEAQRLEALERENERMRLESERMHSENAELRHEVAELRGSGPPRSAGGRMIGKVTKRLRMAFASSAVLVTVVVLLTLTAGVALLLMTFAEDADAKKKKRPPAYNIVPCAAGTLCAGTPGADVMVGAAGEEDLRGAAGNDIYVGSAGLFDQYGDSSVSNDLYGGFQNNEFDFEKIADLGGVDMVDLSQSRSSYASTHFDFFRTDIDGDGVEDDLNLSEKNVGSLGGEDDIYVVDHFGAGRVEYIKFSDTTLKGADLPLS